MWWARLLEVLGLNAVPGTGWALGGWSPSVALILFWVENGLVTITLGARILLHRRWTGLAGHYRPQLGVTMTSGEGRNERPVKFRTFLQEFLTGAIPFVAVHGLFLAGIVLGILNVPIDGRALRQGISGLLAVEALTFAMDLPTLATWPFARLRDRAQHLLGRVILVQLAIIGGMAFLTWRGGTDPNAFFGVFLGLKFLADLGGLVPARAPAALAVEEGVEADDERRAPRGKRRKAR